MKSFFMVNSLCLFLLCIMLNPILIAQEATTQEEDYPYYKWSVRLGGGYVLSYLDFDFNEEIELEGVPADLLHFDVDSGLTKGNYTINFEAKFQVPYLRHWSLGLALDYNVLSVEDVELAVQGGTLVIAKQGEVAKFHTVSVVAFLEYRHPIKMSSTWLVPYAKFGLGVNINTSNNDDLLNTKGASVSVMAALGIEYYITPQIAIFLEPRWYYNRPDVYFTPFDDQTKFTGKAELSYFTCLLGVQFYFGAKS